MSVTSSSPIHTAPPSTSSRPASIRSAVDLPDPDGPTRTMSSPSRISRSSASTAATSLPAYSLVACSKRTSDMGRAPRGRELVAEARRDRQLASQPGMGRGIGGEVVEAQQRRPDDRVLGDDAGGDLRPDRLQALRDGPLQA